MSDHVVTMVERFDQTNPAFGHEHRSVCVCGWMSPWFESAQAANDAGFAHLGVS